MLKPLIIYHKNCDDGFGAAFAAWKKLGDAADYLPMDYRENIDAADFDGRDVTVLDFCFSPDDTFSRVLPRVKSLTVRDHHQSAMDSWKKHLSMLGRSPANGDILVHSADKLDIFFDMSKSGALLAWEHFHPQTPAPRMIDHISDGDLWKFVHEGTKEFYSYLRTHEKDFVAWDTLCMALERDAESVLSLGRTVNRFYEGQLTRIMEARIDVPVSMSAAVDGRTVVAKGLAINASKTFASELGNLMAEKSGSFALVWETDGVTAFCSMRSVPGFDSIPFAQAQGGGGHPQACGFSAPLENMLAALRGEKPL